MNEIIVFNFFCLLRKPFDKMESAVAVAVQL